MKKIAVLAALSLPALALASCNTAVGFGRDIKSLGQGVENKAYGKQWDGKPSAKRPFYFGKPLPQKSPSEVPQTTVQP